MRALFQRYTCLFLLNLYSLLVIIFLIKRKMWYPWVKIMTERRMKEHILLFTMIPILSMSIKNEQFIEPCFFVKSVRFIICYLSFILIKRTTTWQIAVFYSNHLSWVIIWARRQPMQDSGGRDEVCHAMGCIEVCWLSL